MKQFACAILLILLEAACSRSAQSCLERGNTLFRAGKLQDAQLEYRASIAKDPRSPEAYYRLGLTETAIGDGDAALDAFQRAVRFAPDNDQYAIALADLSLEAYQEEPDQKSYDQVRQEAYVLLGKNPNSFDGLRLHGELLLIDRKYEEALRELRKAEAMQPLDPKVNVPMVRALFAQNQAQQAEAIAHRVLAVHRDCAPMYDLLVTYYSDAHRSEDAQHWLEQEIVGVPKDVRPRLKLAALYRDSGRSREMVATLEGIRKEGTLFPNAPGLVGDFYAGAGDWDRALAAYQAGANSAAKDKNLYDEGIARALAATGKPGDAIDKLNQLLKAHPDDFSPRLTRAVLLRKSDSPEDRDMALADLKALSARAPADPVVRDNLNLALAELAEQAENHAETLRLTKQILATDPDNRDARLLYADGLIGIKNYFRARGELESLLSAPIDSTDVNLRLAELDTAEHKYAAAAARYRSVYQAGSADIRPLQGLLQLYVAENQPAKAEALLQEELRQAPGFVYGLKSLGDLYRAEGDLQRAIATYKQASELAPRDESLLNNLALLENDVGDLPAAIVTLRKMLALHPDDAEVMNNLAFDLAETGTDLDQAMTLAATAARKLRDDLGVLDTLGWVYVKAGLNESAIQIFRNLVNKNPDHSVYRYHLGVAFLQAHKSTEAKDEFMIALSQKPSKDLAQKIQALSSHL